MNAGGFCCEKRNCGRLMRALLATENYSFLPFDFPEDSFAEVSFFAEPPSFDDDAFLLSALSLEDFSLDAADDPFPA